MVATLDGRVVAAGLSPSDKCTQSPGPTEQPDQTLLIVVLSLIAAAMAVLCATICYM